MINFQKIDTTCSNVDLIDENKCISSSRTVMMNNFLNIGNKINSIKSKLNNYDNLYSVFQSISSNYLIAAYNIKTINNKTSSPISTVKALSADWLKPITLFYPQFQDIDYWQSIQNSDIQTLLLKWLTQNFDPQNYQNNQTVKIYVMTTQTVSFNFVFSRSYNESCGPNVSGNNTVACAPCPDNRPFQQCNITGLGCRNAWSYCVPTTAPLTKTYKCTGAGGRILSVTLPTIPFKDKHFANTFFYNFKLYNDSQGDIYWEAVS